MTKKKRWEIISADFMTEPTDYVDEKHLDIEEHGNEHYYIKFTDYNELMEIIDFESITIHRDTELITIYDGYME